MIFLKTSKASNDVFVSGKLDKGQIYNIDLNEYINFQFNPQAFEWSRSLNWGKHNWIGNTRGGDLQFLNLSPRVIELNLLYMAEPRSPDVNYKSDFKIIDANGLVDFNAIKNTIAKWEQPLDGSKRPSRIGIMIGENIFEGVLEKYTIRITEFFKDLSVKEGILMLEFTEWQPI